MSNPRRVILETLSQRGPLPLAEIARAARHSPLATRYHLGLLVDAGLVVANAVAHRASVGRPQVLYTLAEPAHAQLPKQYGSLAAQLLGEMIRACGEKETRALLRRAGRQLAKTAPLVRRGARIETRLNRAANFLSARGYLARWEQSNDAWTLYICNCPYHQVAFAHRQVCEMDVALIDALTATPMQMIRCLAKHDAQCAFIVKPSGGH